MRYPFIQPVRYIEKMSKIERELLKLKKRSVLTVTKLPISLKGILKGIGVEEKDFQEAKESLFRY